MSSGSAARRVRAAWTAASRRFAPASSACLANSTIRIAFFRRQPDQDHEADLRQDVVVHTPQQHTADRRQQAHGTIRITASGSSTLSYCAASSRNTNTTRKAERHRGGIAGGLFLQGAISVHSKPKPAGRFAANKLFHRGDRLAC